MWDVNIMILYKNKGDCCDCNIYYGILFLSIVSKLFVCNVL